MIVTSSVLPIFAQKQIDDGPDKGEEEDDHQPGQGNAGLPFAHDHPQREPDA
jgi:hypothetical protein